MNAAWAGVMKYYLSDTITPCPTSPAPSRLTTRRRPSGKYPFTFLLVYFLKKKKKEIFCASLLLKMNLGINLFWILGPSSTFRLFHSYKLVRVQKSKWQVLMCLRLTRLREWHAGPKAQTNDDYYVPVRVHQILEGVIYVQIASVL